MKSLYLLAVSIFLLIDPIQAQNSRQSEPDNTNIEQAGAPAMQVPIGRSDAALLLNASDQRGFSRLQNSEPLKGLGGIGHYAGINQHGSGHDARIDQRGTSNYALMHQYGANNQAVLLQNGSENETYLLQSGTGNVFDVGIYGNANLLGVAQIGDDNLYRRTINDSNRRIFKIQTGNDNRLFEVGESSIPISIEQRGNGMELIIEHN